MSISSAQSRNGLAVINSRGQNDGSAANEPKTASYEVGYAKPPKHSQFKKGQSGNKRGRPKGSRNRLTYTLTGERLKDTFLEEAYRTINVGPAGAPMPIATAVIRSLGVKAAKGHIYAQRLFAQMLLTIEAERRAEANDYMDNILGYKKHWTEVLEYRAKNDLPLDPPVPHPDDILVNMNTGTVEVRGPLSAEDKAKQAYYNNMLAEWRESEAKLRETLEQVDNETSRVFIEGELVGAQKIVGMLEQIVGEDETLSPYEVAKANGLLDEQ